MHTAPTVDYPVGPCKSRTLMLLLPAACSIGVVSWWFARADVVDWRQWTALASASIATALLSRMWRDAPRGLLRWDRKSWRWESSGKGSVNSGSFVGRVETVLDLQSFLLVRFSAESGSDSWLWLERATARFHWGAFRQALYAPSETTDKDAPSAMSTGTGRVAVE